VRLRGFFDEQRKLAELALRVLNLMPANRGGTLFPRRRVAVVRAPGISGCRARERGLNLFEERERLVDLLRESAAESEPGGGSVVIGGEGTDLSGLSVVTAPYEVMGKRAGMIGVIGPRRMQYGRLTTLVDYTASMVGRVLTRLARE
jgi:transcriptional regulator of heat shock response